MGLNGKIMSGFFLLFLIDKVDVWHLILKYWLLNLPHDVLELLKSLTS